MAEQINEPLLDGAQVQHEEGAQYNSAGPPAPADQEKCCGCFPVVCGLKTLAICTWINALIMLPFAIWTCGLASDVDKLSTTTTINNGLTCNASGCH